MMAKISYLLCSFLLTCIAGGEASISLPGKIRYSRDTKYVYLIDSNSVFDEKVQMALTCEVVIYVLSENDIWQDLHVTINSPTVTWITEKGEFQDKEYFTDIANQDWFIVRQTSDSMNIDTISYPAIHEGKYSVTTLKKAVALVLSVGSSTQKSSHSKGVLIKSDDVEFQSGFEKRTKKETVIGRNGELLSVNVSEVLSTTDGKSNQLFHSQMSSRTKLALQKQVPSFDSPQDSNVDLITESPFNMPSTVPDQVYEYDVTVYSKVIELLQCAVTDEVCKQDILKILKSLKNDEDLGKLVVNIFKQTRILSLSAKETISFLDIISKLPLSINVTDVLVESVFQKGVPESVIKKALFYLTTTLVPTEKSVTTLMGYMLSENRVSNDIQERILLALGSISRNIQAINSTVSLNIAEFLNNILSEHINGTSRPYRLSTVIHSIGNAAHDTSIDVIKSTASAENDGNTEAQLAAIRALSKYPFKKVASTLETIAQTSSHPQIQHASVSTYMRLPNRTKDISHLRKRSVRSKRDTAASVMDVPEYNVTMPVVNWGLSFGDDNISVDISRNVMNSFDIINDPLGSKYLISIRDESAFSSSLSLSSGQQENNFLQTDLCLEGTITYSTNIETSYRHLELSSQFDDFQAIVDDLIIEFEAAYNSIVESKTLFTDVKSDFSSSLTSTDAKLQLVSNYLKQFVTHCNEIKDSNGLKLKALEFAARINNSYIIASHELENSQQDLIDLLDMILPVKLDNFFTALLKDSQPFTTQSELVPYLKYAPQTALTGIYEIYWKSGNVLDVLETSVNDFIKLVSKHGPQSNWTNPSLTLWSMENSIDELIIDIELEEQYAVDTGTDSSDLQALSKTITDNLKPALDSLVSSSSTVHSTVDSLSSAMDNVQNGYDEFTQSYEYARSTVDRIFGQKFFPGFPNTVRPCMTDFGCGAYPSTSGELFRSGLDLLQSTASDTIPAPFSGYISLYDVSNPSYNYSQNNSIIVTPTEFSMDSIYLIITNIEPHHTLNDTRSFVKAGEPIGTAKPFGDVHGIHIEVYKTLENVTYNMNPTQFVSPQLKPTATVEWDCNEITTIVNGVVVETQDFASTDPEKELIGDPLISIDIDDEEFPQPYDLILEHATELSSTEAVEFFQTSTFLMVGVVPVTFAFHSFGQYSLNASLNAALLSRNMNIEVTPEVWGKVQGSMRVGDAIYALVDIDGSLLNVSLPMTISQNSGSWPLSAGSNMDLILHPTSLNLTTKLMQRVGTGDSASENELESDVRWSYSIPDVELENEFDYINTYSDLTPPVFHPLEYANDSLCSIRQLSGRKFFNPAFELEYSVSETEGLSNVQLLIGTQENIGNALSKTVVQGERLVLPSSLSNEKDAIVTLIATNRDGLQSSANCIITNYDLSPPQARVVPYSRITSHPEKFEVLLSLFDEYGLEDYMELAIGTVAGLEGNDIMDWIKLDTDIINQNKNEFSFPRNGRLIENVLSMSNEVDDNDDCRSLCLDDCLSYDYSESQKRCILHSSIEGPQSLEGDDFLNTFSTLSLKPSADFVHHEALGRGNSTVYMFSGLQLEHGQEFFINLILRNKLGFSNVVSSSSVLVDLTPPTPGRVRNTNETLALEECGESFNILHKCKGETTTINNHRVIYDGTGSHTIFNGPSPFVDALYTKASSFISANWDGIEDRESGLLAYTWCISSTTLYSCDTFGPANPHGSGNSDQVYWTNTGLATFADELEDGDYYVTVDAINNAIYGGAMVTTIHHTTPYTVDTTPPVIQRLTVIDYDIYNNILLLNISVSDSGSGIKEVAVSVGTTVDNTEILPWSSVDVINDVVNVSVVIPDGVNGWIKLRAINNVDLQSITTSSSPINVDRSPPTAGQLYDGSVKGVDIEYQSNSSEICMNWKGVVDAHSGIVALEWGIGTSLELYDVLPLQNVTDEEMADRLVCASVDLKHGVSYYSILIATNGADIPLTTTMSSNGVLIDTTKPNSGVVRDGTSVDIKYSHSLTTLEANWDQFSDPESGIAEYSVTVYQMMSGSDTAGVVLTKNNVETNTYYGNHFHFSNGDIISVKITGFNGAGLSVSAMSDGYTIDLTAPEVMALSDGSNSASDLDYFSNSSYSFNWVAFDYESGVSAIEFVLYQLIGGKKTKVYPELEQTRVIEDMSLTKYSIDDIEFMHGFKYKATLLLTNGAGLKSSFETDGAIADFVPPTMESVIVFGDTLTYDNELDDILQLGNNKEVDASWYGSDDGSGITEFIVCVVDNNNVVVAGCSTFDKDANSGTVSGLNLTVGTEEIGPFYKVQVTAVDYVGLKSQPIYSDAFWISGGEYSGDVYDGFYPFEDIDYTYEMSSISTYFNGFMSHQCGGIVDYQWAIGQNSDDKTSVMSFTDYGLTLTGNGSGYAQLPLHLNGYLSEELYITVQGVTGCGDIMESTSNGFTIDSTPPIIDIIQTSHQAIENISSKDVYQTQMTFSSVWRTMEDSYDSSSRNVTVSIGSYPGGVDFMNETEVNSDHIRKNILSADGVPSYVTVSMSNKAGLESVQYSSPVVLDTSPPEIEFITCSMFSSIISCDWNVHDPESGIDYVLLSLASDSVDKSRITYTELSGLSCSVTFDISKYSSEQPFYVVLYAYNNAELETIRSSTAIYVDTTPPMNDGVLYVIPNFGEQNYTDDSAENSQTPKAVCIWETDVIQLKFSTSYDDDSEIAEYQLAIGWTPSDDSILAFHKVTVEIKDDGWTYYNLPLFNTINSLSRNPYYFTIRAVNDVGLYFDVTSSPVYFKSEQTTLSSWVYDGDNNLKDREYQAFTDVFDGNAFFGINCPMKLVEWSIEGSDGIVIKSFMEINVNYENNSYSFTTDQVTYDNETYRITVRGIDYSGQTHVIKSDGLIVTKRQLSPGIVREGVQGLLPLSYQESLTSLLFYFEGFGDGTDEQEIEYFEVALGSDKKYANTRSDIVPFTNIGLEKSYKFVNLSLISETQTYFTTVRAHAVSGAVAEATSNGIVAGLTHAILPGQIHQTEFQYNTTFLSAYWVGFESNVPITKYEWALGTVAHNDSFLQSLCEDRTDSHESDFNVFGFVDLETSTYGYADQLSLEHGKRYFVTIRVTDESDMCITVVSKVPTVVDTTLPIVNDITVGVEESRLNLPIQDEYIAYLSQGSSSLTVSWKNFMDAESSIKSYEIGIFGLVKCSSANLVDSDAIVDYIEAGLKNEFTFENINLDSNVSYIAKIKATNKAGLTVIAKSNPILVDTYELSAGQVKDGTSWENDLVFQSDRTKLSGVLALSYLKPNKEVTTPCPSNKFYSFVTPNDDWSNDPFTEFNGLESTALEYLSSNAEIKNDTGLTITARFQSSGKKQVVSGVYHALLSDFNGRKSISLMVRPADGDASLVNYTVTSLLILESSDEELLVEYDPTVTSESSSVDYKALGLQIHSQNGTDQHKLVLWTKESTTHSKVKTASIEIMMNSSIAHKIEFEFYYEMHGLYMKTKVEVRVNDILTLVLHDIPQFNAGSKFILHVFNREGYIPYCDLGCINPPAVTASFFDVSLPTEVSEVCEYGTPFHSWSSPIVQIKGGIGTSATSADIKPLEVVYVPCRSCALPSTPCYSYGCDKACPSLSDPHTVSFSFTHISLQQSDNDTLLSGSGSGAGDDEQSDSRDVAGYFESVLQPTVYYIIIEATTASGQNIQTSSNGVLIDVTSPVQTVPIHLYDVEFSLTQSSAFQGNNHTISATWGFKDLESGIVDYAWSIGKKPYGQEIQEYVSVGTQTHATNSSLQGLLLHNETYYVTVRATNGAGLSSVVTSSGITHLSVELNETELNNGIIITSSKVILDINNVSLYIVSAEENIEVIITTNVEDVDETNWGLGSHIDQSYDIFPLTSIGQGVTARVDHKLLYIDSVPHGNVSDILALSDGVHPSEITGLYIEPGRVFYHTVEFCDLAHSCITSSPRQAMFLRSSDITVISYDGEDLNFTMTLIAPQDPNITVNVSTLDSNHSVSITTTGGLQKGTWLFAGFLQEEYVTRVYHVDLPYISNPYLTMDQTSRELARRFSSIGGPSFFVSFYGEEVLNGELLVSTTFDALLNWTTSVPRLAYWDIDNSEWREVEDTCGSQTAVNWTTYTLSVEICTTIVDGVDVSSRPSSLARRRRRNIDIDSSASGMEDDPFLERPVQFIVIERGNVSSNTPPKLVIESPVTLNEDDSLIYQIPYEDAEDDDVLFYVTSVPKLGVASVDPDTGMLTYTPCENCIGYDTLEIYIIETNLKFGRELDATGLLQLYISNVNDPLVSFLFENTSSNNIWPSDNLYVYVEANRTEPVTIAKVGSYDFDGYEDDMEVYVTGASAGAGGYITWLDVVAVPESLPVNWLQDSSVVDFNSYIAFLGADITYLPEDPEYIGNDEMYVYAQQEDTVTSAFLRIIIEVIPSVCLNNGVCNGSSTDPDCTDIDNRKNNPTEYNCTCPNGYSGSYCQNTDIIEEEEELESQCPGNIPVVDCGGNPCDGAVCPGYRDSAAICVPDYCGHCHAVWYLDNEIIQCSASDEDVCFEPVIPGLTLCIGMTCDCPSQPYECPVDSIYVETRVDSCCVEYSCVCPDISCPLLMDSSKNVYPQPDYRGGLYPGRCCPKYAFTDINECEDTRLHMCSDDCINTDQSYSCGCEDGVTLASDGHTCGVCEYDGAQYLYGDRVKIGCNWCTCQEDSLSGERWHCTANTCDPNCYYNGTTYSVDSQLVLASASCSCEATDTFAEWSCQPDV